MALTVDVWFASRDSDYFGSLGMWLWDSDVPKPDPVLINHAGRIAYDEKVASLIYWLKGPEMASKREAHPPHGVDHWRMSAVPEAQVEEQDMIEALFAMLDPAQRAAAEAKMIRDRELAEILVDLYGDDVKEAEAADAELLRKYVILVADALHLDTFYPENFAIGFSVPRLLNRRREPEPAAVREAKNDLALRLEVAVRRDHCDECPDAEELDAAVAITRAAKRGRRDAIFAAYRLNGLDEDLAELLGDCMAAVPDAVVPSDTEFAAFMDAFELEAPPPAPASPKIWKNYAEYVTPQGKNDPNCLLNELIERYCINIIKQKAISEKKLREFFPAVPDGGIDTSIRALVGFCEKYAIPLRLYTALSRNPIVSLEGSKTTKRPSISILCWNGHAYVFTGSDLRKSAPELVGDMPQLAQKPPTRVRDTLDEKAREIYGQILRAIRPNFFFEAESQLTVKSFFGSMRREADMKTQDYVTVDMSKCFHSALHSAPADDQIGVFTACDSWEKYADEPIVPHAYYLIKKEVVAGWKAATEGLLQYRVNNLITGYELEYLLEHERIAAGDIEWAKVPQYTTPAIDFRKKLTEIAEKEFPASRAKLPKVAATVTDKFKKDVLTHMTPEEGRKAAEAAEALNRKTAAAKVGGESLKANFGRCFNGLLGIKETHPTMFSIFASQEDAHLLIETHGGASQMTDVRELADAVGDDSEEWGALGSRDHVVVKVVLGERSYMYLSNRHLYHYVVARANIAVMMAAESLAPVVGWPLRCRTDGFTFERPADMKVLTDAIAKLAHVFRIEAVTKPPDGLRAIRQYIDGEALTGEIAAEIERWNRRHTAYTGAPGTGKTTLIKKEYAGKYKYALALTNMCARQLTGNDIDGSTLHSKLRLFCPDELGAVCREFTEPIWVDEISMINPWIWSVLFVVGQRTPLIFTGDPRQCSPIGKNAAGKISGDPLNWEGPLLKHIVDTSEKLTVDYRNDAGLIAFREAICDDERPEFYMYRLLKAHPEMKGDTGDNYHMLMTDHHIVWGHDYRVRLNAAILAVRDLVWERKEVALARTDKTTVRNKKGKAYTFNISAGVKMIARSSQRPNFYKGTFYTLVEPVTHKSKIAKLQELKAGSDTPVNGILEIPAAMLINFGIGYAITAPSSQGMTIEGKVVIHQLASMLKGGEFREIAYTAVTRLRTLKDLTIVPYQLTLAKAPDAQAEVWNLFDEEEDLGTALSVAK